jgi:hypothetical protein
MRKFHVAGIVTMILVLGKGNAADSPAFWVSVKFPEAALINGDSSMPCFSFEANAALHHQFLKVIYSHGDEKMFPNFEF